MNKNPSRLTKIFFLVLIFTITLANLTHAFWRCDGPTYQCQSQTIKVCRGVCETQCDQEDVWYEDHGCSYGICYEYWSFECPDQSVHQYDCINYSGLCPVK